MARQRLLYAADSARNRKKSQAAGGEDRFSRQEAVRTDLVDRIPLYLLDTNVKENSLDDRTITHTLGGDRGGQQGGLALPCQRLGYGAGPRQRFQHVLLRRIKRKSGRLE